MTLRSMFPLHFGYPCIPIQPKQFNKLPGAASLLVSLQINTFAITPRVAKAETHSGSKQSIPHNLMCRYKHYPVNTR